MNKMSALSYIIVLFVIVTASSAIAAEDKFSKFAIDDKSLNTQLDQIDKSIDRLLESISRKPVEKQDYNANKDAAATSVGTGSGKAESEIIKQRLDSIERSITNIGKALTGSKTEIGSNCYFVDVCTFVVCIRYSAPPNVSGGTPVCVESECRAWETRFVCK